MPRLFTFESLEKHDRSGWYVDKRNADGGETVAGATTPLTQKQAEDLADLLNRARGQGQRTLSFALDVLAIIA